MNAGAKTPSEVRDELLGREPADPVTRRVLGEVWQIVGGSRHLESLKELHLAVFDPDEASEALLGSKFSTHSFKARRDESVIVVNERFLLELEGAVRSFGQAGALEGIPYLKADGHLFGLVKQIESDPRGYLRRPRRRSARDEVAEQEVIDAMVLLVLFFVGHELGHLVAGDAEGLFGGVVEPGAVARERLEEAVVKLCRHVDEFAPTQFGLPGFEDVADGASDVRKVAAELAAKDPVRHQRNETFFDAESRADAWANRIAIEHVERVAESDPVEAERRVYLLARSMCAAALYTWYRDLCAFGRGLGIEISDARDLTHTLMRGSEMYVGAAALFGEEHRFALLRAALGLEVILRARTDWFERDPETRTIGCAFDDDVIERDPEAKREWWLSQSLKCYFLLCISMDTAVKIANVGAAGGWRALKEKERDSPQMLVMSFEPINAAMERLAGLR